MSQPKNSVERPRRVWRITPGAPLGEIVEPAVSPPTGSDADSIAKEMADAGWRGSTFDLLNGLDIIETSPGEDIEDFFGAPVPKSSKARTGTAESAVSKHQWILRFALKAAALDLHSDPKTVIALARVLWPTRGSQLPEDAATERYGLER